MFLKVLSGKSRLLIASIIIVYYSVVVIFTENFPISDDFVLVGFLNNFIGLNSFSEKMTLLFKLHNEHRIFLTRVIFLLYYKLFGTLNFTYLCLIGNLAIAGMFYVIIKQLPSELRKNSSIVVIITCMLFQYGSSESMLWAMASISNYYVLFFALLTMNFIAKNSVTNFVLALLFAVLATFTQGNGIVILVIGNLYLLSQRRYRYLCLWMFITGIVCFAYFYGYQSPQHHSDPFAFFANAGKAVIFMLAFIGSAFGVGGSHYQVLTTIFLVPTIAIGIFVCATTLWLFYKKRYQDGNIFIWINLFIILTAFLTALSRLNFGLSQALVPKYHINSNLILISTFLMILQSFSLKEFKLNKHLKTISLFCVVYVILSFPMVCYFSFIAYGPVREGGIIYPVKSQAVKILKDAEANGVFVRKF